MFERLIVATDLSQATSALLHCLAGLKRFGAERCLLLQCISVHEGASLAYSYQADSSERVLDEQKKVLEKQGFTVEARTVFASAKREVNRIAKEQDYALIVVGSQGRSFVAEKALGGTAFSIISKADRPVLVMPVERMPGDEQACKPIGRCSFGDHVLYATDFSEISDRAFAYVERMVERGVTKFSLLHVQDQSRIRDKFAEKLDEFNEIDRQRLEQLQARLKERGPVEIDLKIFYGLPKQEIVHYVERTDVSLTVLGSQGKGFWGEFLMGSVAAHVARRSGAPTLFIPPLKLTRPEERL